MCWFDTVAGRLDNAGILVKRMGDHQSKAENLGLHAFQTPGWPQLLRDGRHLLTRNDLDQKLRASLTQMIKDHGAWRDHQRSQSRSEPEQDLSQGISL